MVAEAGHLPLSNYVEVEVEVEVEVRLPLAETATDAKALSNPNTEVRHDG
jgi:hypothetical protein